MPAPYYYFSVDTPYLQGASGSPVLNEQGQISGVAFYANENMLTAIKVSYLKEFVIGNIGVKCSDFSFINTIVGFINAKDCIKKGIKDVQDLAGGW